MTNSITAIKLKQFIDRTALITAWMTTKRLNLSNLINILSYVDTISGLIYV